MSPVSRAFGFAFTLALVVVSTASHADQAEWISETSARAAAARIAVGSELREYCAPCGTQVYSRQVSSVGIAPVNAQYWKVVVNGTAIDLAYEYVPVGGRWLNLATQVGVAVQQVPAELPSSAPVLDPQKYYVALDTNQDNKPDDSDGKPGPDHWISVGLQCATRCGLGLYKCMAMGNTPFGWVCAAAAGFNCAKTCADLISP